MAALVKRLFDLNCVGGNLHIVVDDWNVEDDHLAYCRNAVTRVRYGTPNKTDDTYAPQVAIEAEILDLMEPMSDDERYSALALSEEFI